MAENQATDMSFKRLTDLFSHPPGTPPTSTMRMIHDAYQAANIIETSENPETVDCRAEPKCSSCTKRGSSISKPLLCGGCRAHMYCSRQLTDWKSEIRPHKAWCALAKEYMQRHPYFLSQLNQFPWARIEADGTLSHRIFEARLGVYGPGKEFGYWSVPVSPDIHDKERYPHPKRYIHGEVMLERRWPSHIDAWRFANNEDAPRLAFTTTGKFPPSPLPPNKVELGEIRDWKSWYTWRGVSMASPAALLMHYPLSVYHILVNVLRLAKCKNVSTRRTLHIHYIGAEKELNHLPLFSELALLLPGMDITLTIFGKPVFDLVKKARKGSIAAKHTVWSYMAPQATGGSCINMQLYSKAEHWTPDVLKEMDEPDALIGLNAGLGNYHMWMEPIKASFRHNIPFGTTDYEEEDMQFIVGFLKACVEADGSACGTFPVTPNPFHMPGHGQSGYLRVPTLSNGFVMTVCGGEEECSVKG